MENFPEFIFSVLCLLRVPMSVLLYIYHLTVLFVFGIFHMIVLAGANDFMLNFSFLSGTVSLGDQ